ncbi:MAG: PKD domain-containing protein [Crocinitomicaceae bacterium]|nr:PKD domain-containing protein [Crocinitomicaceae bacterium]MBK8926348.1 PKD domain-containing protein [Crocinitomicaceae bacterium]
MKKIFNLFLLGAATFVLQNLNAQTVIWSEDFDPTPGGWTYAAIGPNGADPNFFEMDDDESGVAPPGCGVAGTGNQTLHITSVFFPGGGAAYDAGGLCGILTCPQTATRAQSPNISTVGYTNLTLSFDYIMGGDASDFGGLWYNDGMGWVALTNPLPQTPGGCLPQGQWTNYSIALPVSCENIANLQIGFSWINNDDGVGTDPSIAINDIEITTPTSTPPVASFTTTSTTICVGDCIDFTNTSTGGPFTTTDWTFTGATPATSAVNNPTNICYNTAGTYDVSLFVEDANGNDIETTVGYITVVNTPNAGADGSSNICNNATLDLNTLLSGADAGGIWAETSGTPSGQFTAGTGVLDGNGLGVGNVYTFTYTVSASCGSDVSTFTITVIDCSAGTPPTADFSASQTTICAGDCITFIDLSTPGDITNWAWDWGGGATPNNFVGQHPSAICFDTPGTFTVTLAVINPFGNDTETMTITVNALPTVTANASPSTTICAGDPVTLTGGGASTYTWTGGVTNGTPFTPAATATYTVTGTDANMCENTANITITVTTCVPMVAGFSYNDNICAGDCITFTDTTTGSPISWNWDFGGGGNPATSTDQNPVVCFDAPGTYNIQLTTTDAGGNNSSTTNSISVFALPTVTAELDTTIDIGGAVELIAAGSGSGSYMWTPDDGDIDCDTCSSTYAYPLIDTEFFVVFTDINGCTAQDTVSVVVNFIEGIGIPQAFSPNGDDQNDVLFVLGYGIKQMNFTIYNRYGQKVFETTDQTIGWDGTFKGKDENPGVFVWVLEYTFITGQGGVMNGNTTLIR